MTHFIFCHGFGLNYHFWDPIMPYFSKYKCSFIDLGYFSNQTIPLHKQGEKIIGIGHSIGLSKLINLYNNFECLIGLNSFINFLGFEQNLHKKRQQELKALRLSFLKNPTFALKSFYNSCGISDCIEGSNLSKLNVDLILSDFEWLKEEYTLPSVPTLILNSNNDIIVPSTITLDNFSKQPNVRIDSVAGVGHALGFKKPLKVYEKIIRFLNEKSA